jgi:putative isomerase
VLEIVAFGMFMIGAQLGTPDLTATQPAAVHKIQSVVGVKNYAKLVRRLKDLNSDVESKGIHKFPGASGKMLTGYAYGEYYDWDLYFENVYLSYYGVSKYNFTNFKTFLDRQQPDGFVSRTLGLTYPRPRQMFKPFLAQIAVLGSKQNGDSYEWLRARYYGILQKYLQRWFAYDSDGNGLPVWNSSDASGMDNQISRSGDLDSYQDEGVDLACELYRELQAMEAISEKLGKMDDAKAYTEHAFRLAKEINAVFWDEKDGFYYDRNQKTGRQIRVKSVAGFFPLWAGVASRKQAERLVRDHLLNPNEFWLKYPVATYAKTESDFYEGSKDGECNWRGPVWIPANYIIFHGLVQYGYDSVAQDLAVKTLQMALNENAVTREYYDSDTGRGNGMNPFWGWSSLAYVMPIDLAEHYNPMNLDGAIRPVILDDMEIKFEQTAE